VSKKASFIADQRGAVAVETIIVYFFLVVMLLLPLADVAIAGFQYLSAWQALRGFGQSVQYAPPPDVTNVSSGWTSSTLAKAAAAGLQNFGIQVLCGDNNIVCSTTNQSPPKYYSYTATVTLSPILLRPVLCTSGNANPCTFTLSDSERFQ
jgi:Flp pilus assembly protein TadG